ncbi:MAG: RidA family protein [Nitrospinota bacterium]
MKKEIVASDALHRKIGPPIGPYSHGVKAEGTLLFIAGQVAWDAEGKVVGKDDIGAQYERIMENIKAILEEAGAGMDSIVKITNYVTKRVTKSEEYSKISEVRRRYIPRDFPASALIQVEALMDPDLLVEVEAVAVI